MITILLPISRKDYLRPVFNCLIELEKPLDTELIIITDGNAELERAVDKRLDLLHFKRIQVLSFGDTPAEDIDSRRYRISAIHNKLRQYIPENCEYVFSIEDDTTYPFDTLTKMLGGYKASFIQGVQLGRRNSPYIGGWNADDINEPRNIKSVMPYKHVEYEEIDAGGLYCALIDANLYRSHTFEPFDKEGTNGLSCDVNFGLYIKRMGGHCFIDWSIQCDHIGDRGSVNLGNTTPEQLTFEKNNGEWKVRRNHDRQKTITPMG